LQIVSHAALLDGGLRGSTDISYTLMTIIFVNLYYLEKEAF